MDINDPLDGKQEQDLSAPPARKNNMTREEAIAYGAKLGADEAARRLESGQDRDMRIRRAKAYAAWEWDGKPASSEPQRREFGVSSELTASLQREASKIKKGKA